MENETTVTMQLGPLASHLKRKAEFFEQEATQLAMLLERAYTKPVAVTPETEETK